MTHAETFERVTGFAPTSKNVSEVQRWLGVKDDGVPGRITAACVESEWYRRRLGYTPASVPSGELLFVRCPGAARTLTQRNHRGEVRYECRVYWMERGLLCSAPARTLPMQSSSKEAPLGHVAVVRPGVWDTTNTTHKGASALRFSGETLCWRNLASPTLPVVTAADRAKSEAMRKREYPQCGDRGLFAIGILFHPGPPVGFSIGCFTAERDTVEHLVSIAPVDGWRIQLIDPHEAA